MGESACLAQPFHYGSGIASGAEQGNPMHALGDSVSFGRFTSESLSWEKWSSFSHKSYVEEAERYAQPGSVAQKKAFFEAHYRSIAAKKAAALLEQANAANHHPKPEFEQQFTENLINHSNGVYGNDDNSNAELQKAEDGQVKSEFLSSISAVPRVPAKPAAPIQPGRENKETLVAWNTATHSTDKQKLTPKSQHHHIYSTSATEEDGSTTPATQRIDSLRAASSPNNKSNNRKTPTSTPIKASANGVLVNPLAIPSSESKRSRTQHDISTPGSKTRAKWHILFAVCSKSFSACRDKSQFTNLSSPNSFRTEERAARRKQKLEEKFNANEGQKVQLQTRLKEKTETELNKLRRSLCFRAQPLPDLYKENETAKDQIKNAKIPLPHPNSPKLGRGKPNSSPLQGIASPPSETTSSKKSRSKNFLDKEKSNRKSVLLAP